MNIARYLAENARLAPDRIAVAAPGPAPHGGLPTPDWRVHFRHGFSGGAAGNSWRMITFAELDALSDRLATGLAHAGIREGLRTLVMVRPGIELTALLFALFRARAVPVLIDPGMGLRSFLACAERARPGALVGTPLAHTVRLLQRRAFRSVTHPVTVGRRWLWGGPTLADLIAPPSSPAAPAPRETSSDDVAAVLFTSGSTGPAKGVVYTHGMFDAQIQALRRVFAFEPGEVDLAAFPLFAFFDAALGMTAVVPDLDPSAPARCNPDKVAATLRAFACTSASGSPAIWRRVFAHTVAHGVPLPDLRRLITYGAPIPTSLVELCRQAMPAGEVFTPYGATEALPVACTSGREILEDTAEETRRGRGTCVGRPDLEVRVIATSDEPIPDMAHATVLAANEPGEICVRGPVVTHTYDALPEATRSAKIHDGSTIWHRMGDIGYLDERGRLWFCGRKAERVETADGVLHTGQIEGIFDTWPEIRRTALVGLGPRGAERPVLVVEGPEDRDLARRILAEPLPRGRLAAVEFLPSFPVDRRHNAKIHRLAIKARLEREGGARPR